MFLLKCEEGSILQTIRTYLYSRTVSESMIDVVDVVAAPVAVIVGALEALRCGAPALRIRTAFFFESIEASERASSRSIVGRDDIQRTHRPSSQSIRKKVIRIRKYFVAIKSANEDPPRQLVLVRRCDGQAIFPIRTVSPPGAGD